MYVYSLSSTAARFKPSQLCLSLSISFLVDLRFFCRLGCLCIYVFPPMALQPKLRIGRLFLRFLYQTQLDTLSVGRLYTIRRTVGRTPLNEWSIRHRGQDVRNEKQTQEANFHAFCGIRTRDPNKQAAAYARLRPHGHSDRTSCLKICT